MDLNDVHADFLQLKPNEKALTEAIEVLQTLLLSHTAANLKALYKIFDGDKTPHTSKPDLVVQLVQMIMKK